MAQALSPEPDDRIVCVVGAGYVGLVTGVGPADLGHEVRIVEIDPARRAAVTAGRCPIHEPGLDAVLAQVVRSGRLRTVETMRQGVEGAGIVMVAVGAPPTPDGEADLTQVRQAVGEALLHAGPDVVIAIKSTIPPGSTRARAAAIARKDVAFVMCPEFLRRAPRCTTSGIPAASLGGEDSKARLRVAALFDGLDAVNLLCDSTSAELIKYSSNAFLATKISFINEMAQLCELTGADID